MVSESKIGLSRVSELELVSETEERIGIGIEKIEDTVQFLS